MASSWRERARSNLQELLHNHIQQKSSTLTCAGNGVSPPSAGTHACESCIPASLTARKAPIMTLVSRRQW